MRNLNCHYRLLLLALLLLAASCDRHSDQKELAQPSAIVDREAQPPATHSPEEPTMIDDTQGDTAPAETNTYVTPEAHARNLEKQTSGAAQIVAQMRKGGIPADRELALDIYFYTDTAEKAAKLAATLQERQYNVKSGPAASDPKALSVTGQTAKMKMDEAVVVDWARQMCELGFQHDCEFDGWGVNPKQ